MTVPDRARGQVPPYTANKRGGFVKIPTGRLTLLYKRGSGPFGPDNTSIALKGPGAKDIVARPRFGAAPPPSKGPPSTALNAAVREAPNAKPRTSGNLGGWYRALDLAGGPVDAARRPAVARRLVPARRHAHRPADRPRPPGFARGPRATAPTRTATSSATATTTRAGSPTCGGSPAPAPLLPRKAFGVWFSRYWAYRQAEYPPAARALPRASGCRSTCSGRTPTSRRRTPGTAGTGTAACSPTRRGSSTGRTARASRCRSTPTRRSPLDDPRLAGGRAPRRRAAAVRSDGHPLPRSSTGRATARHGTAAVPPGCKVFDWARAGDQDAYFCAARAVRARRASTSGGSTSAATRPTRSRPGSRRTRGSTTSTRSATRPRQPLAGALARRRLVLRPGRGGRGASGPSTATPSTSPATRGPPGRCSTSRPRSPPPRATSASPTCRTTSAASAPITADGLPAATCRTTSTCAGSSRARSSPSCDSTPTTATGCPGSTGPARRADRDRVPAPARRAGAVPLHARARGARQRAADGAARCTCDWPELDDAVRARPPVHARAAAARGAGRRARRPGDARRSGSRRARWIDIFTRRAAPRPGASSALGAARADAGIRTGRRDRAAAGLPARAATAVRRPAGRSRPTRAARGAFTLYEDAGDGLGHERGQYANTRIHQIRGRGLTKIAIGAADGDYPGRAKRRFYELRIRGADKPRQATANGRKLEFTYEAETRTVVTRTPPLDASRTARILVR